ncbi:PQQ-binding-like beta-propeller repeat protein [Pelagibacterium luteolum]|uniref:Alcohol dehydrogenase (Cytochrome c) n=1 Tax=Pelagibacterium luteolum TaxID=440168 RepID=A0A1G7ULQ7_9HYPH|nr:PQQ-binding-like beta-propeller repeat protein [Pelagibacterium luteolum]SDG48427.1 alcohol dehydrogenase (cytochrome c) [Pelagibacterium luteolum]
MSSISRNREFGSRKYLHRGVSIFGLAAIWGLGSAGALYAQDYVTEEQAARGQSTYEQRCATCHGSDIISSFANYPNAELFFNYVSTAMPADAPGSLPAQQYADIVGYLLTANGMPTGSEELPPEPTILAQLTPGAGAEAPDDAAAEEEDAAPEADAAAAAPAAEVAEPVTEVADDTSGREYSPVTDEMILDPDPADWLSWRRTVNSWGYSPLDQINQDTVGDLELAWSWALGEAGQQEVMPIIHDGIMFLATNNNYVEALDAETGDLLWSYTHTRPEFQGGYHNNQAMRQKNSIALYGDDVILTTVDAKLISLDALTGQINWEVQVNDWEAGYSYTAGPLIADGKIFAGTSGCSIVGTAGACWITAHDAETGEELWRFNTLEDPNNPDFEDSWGGVPQENRWGATPWATASYDPDLNMVYFGTGMPIPYMEITRGTGDNDVLYTNSTLAFDADTGELKWYFQHLPRDNWDLDSPFERLIIDAEVDGEMRKMIVTTPGKNGITFGLDAETGEFIWAEETVYQNVVSDIDPETGRATANVEIIPTEFGEAVTFCPAIPGGRLWQASAYSPDTGLFYVQAANTCQTMAATEMSEAAPGTAMGMIQGFGESLAPDATGVGSLHALNAIDGEHAFDVQQGPRFTSSILPTAGRLLFVGDADRYIKALDDETGETLWQHRLQAPVGGTPATYEVDGVQYLVIAAGQSNQTHAALTPGGLATPRLGGNSIHVFRLPNQGE